ncbi:MAG TPA: leucyl/phenylalanyl-tRNA--protein transferase [Desulfuromonadales bacterium]|nr:leucyl/phenylalanyl-tRNA--protein transferase [Desulfuromonadales bacterium]
MPIFRLSQQLVFPDPQSADRYGLLAVGGDLSAERILLAYRLGIFPWYSPGDPILWWSPDPRCILLPADVYVSRRLARTWRKQRFRVTTNSAFEDVIRSCAETRLEKGEATWLVPDMQAAYLKLHRLGYAHSVEVWQENRLIGGLYGIALRPFFFGESMFHRETDASKIALAAVARWLAGQDFLCIDCQLSNDHLLRMGAQNVPRKEFLADLRREFGLLDADLPEGRRVRLPDRLETI